MSIVKISELADAPAEGMGKGFCLEHPFTCIKYDLALFKIKEKYYVIADRCHLCNSGLAQGQLNGLVVACMKGDHLWNIKTGVCKFNRVNSLPTYSVSVETDGLYINI
ncbi:MAG: hypothetical protein A3K09_06995 [Nitrospinae bacterium RIFCSPLOWO2_12_FULL_47_7]|nr:MAG: hypothetical protein A3K09_06995 [Nitrospinae bacterium RIFCSPLOWO2_12_FULL_47_7]